MGSTDHQNWYLLLDSSNIPLARGHLESPPDAPNMQVRIAEGKVNEVLEHEDIQLISVGQHDPSLLGRIIAHRKDIIVLEKLKALGAEIRHNLRMSVSFESFIYPLTGTWQGRYSVVAHDLSCGGISFSCDALLENGEQVEIVVPSNSEPLLLRCEILRQRPSGRETALYAAKFIELCDDEERLVRESVFSAQVHTRVLNKYKL